MEFSGWDLATRAQAQNGLVVLLFRVSLRT